MRVFVRDESRGGLWSFVEFCGGYGYIWVVLVVGELLYMGICVVIELCLNMFGLFVCLNIGLY